jgi:transcriptional regulator with XRE-family HTH domain
MDYHRLGRAIKKRRFALKLTQQQLAEMISKSTVYVSLIESGSRRPSLDTVLNIALSLRTGVDALIADKAARGGDAHVDEFKFLTAGRSKDEIALAMDMMRELLLHIDNGAVVNPRRGALKPELYAPPAADALPEAAARRQAAIAPSQPQPHNIQRYSPQIGKAGPSVPDGAVQEGKPDPEKDE